MVEPVRGARVGAGELAEEFNVPLIVEGMPVGNVGAVGAVTVVGAAVGVTAGSTRRVSLFEPR